MISLSDSNLAKPCQTLSNLACVCDFLVSDSNLAWQMGSKSNLANENQPINLLEDHGVLVQAAVLVLVGVEEVGLRNQIE